MVVSDETFVVCVYGILFTQLSLTGVVALGMTILTDFRQWCLIYAECLLFCALVVILLCLGLLYAKIVQNVHYRLCCFLGFTLGLASVIGIVSAELYTTHHSILLLNALATTIGTVASQTLFVAIALEDVGQFNQCVYQVLYILFSGFVIWNFIAPMTYFWSGLMGITLFCTYIVVDTHRLMHSTCKFNRDPLCSAIDLYLDIINVFVFFIEFFIQDDE